MIASTFRSILTLCLIALILFANTLNRASANPTDLGGSVHQLVLNTGIDNGSNPNTAHFATLRTPACVANPAPAYVNPFSLNVAVGGAVQGYQANWQNPVVGVEITPTYNNFLGLGLNLVGSARYFNYGTSGYWKDKCQWTIGAEAPLGGGATLFTRYENHFLTADDWFFGGIRFALQ